MVATLSCKKDMAVCSSIQASINLIYIPYALEPLWILLSFLTPASLDTAFSQSCVEG